MTAIAAVRQSAGILVASDGVCYLGDGTINHLQSKVLLLPHLSTVLGTTGANGIDVGYLDALAGGFRGTRRWAGSFDDIIRDLPGIHEYAVDAVSDAAGVEVHGTALVAGWSDRAGDFEMYRISSRSKQIVGRADEPAFVASIVPEIWSSYWPPDPDEHARFGIGTETDPARFVMRCICMARAQSGATDANGTYFSAGGFLQLTQLGRDGCNSQIVHRWPEGVGDKVDLSNGELLPAHLFGTRPEGAA